MSIVTYRRGEQTVEIDEFRVGTRRILEAGGFKLIQLEPAPEPEPEPVYPWPIEDVGNLPANVVETLMASYDSPSEVREASDDALLSIDGIGPATLQKIREALG